MRTVATSLIALALATPAWAQDAPATQIALDELVITANLVPTAQDRTGVKVAVLRDEELRRAGEAPLTDVLARLPGVSLTRNGGFGTSSTLRIRGAEGYYVPVYIDGVLVTDPAATQPGFDMGAMLASDVGRIEVLYGSQSALFGGSAIGGVINIETRAAQAEGRENRFALEGGSYGTLAASWNYAQRTAAFEQSLTLSHLKTEGFSASSAGSEKDGAEATRLSYSTRYQVNDTLAVGASAFAQRGWNDYDGGTLDTDNRAHKEETGGRVFAEYSLGDSTHRIEASAFQIARRYVTPTTESLYDGGRRKLAYTGSTTLSDALRLAWGADATREEAELTALPGGTRHTSTTGLFGQALYSPRAGVDLSFSLRGDHNSDFGDFVTGRLAGAVAVSDALTLRGAIGTGFRAPSLSERYAVYDAGQWGVYRGNPNLKPEESLSLEAGVDAQLGAGQVSATLFQIKTDEKIDYLYMGAPGGVALYEVQNLPGTSTRRGIELSGDWALSDRLSLTGGYSYIDAKDASGARLARVPRHNLNLGLAAKLDEASRATVDVNHVSGLIDRGATMPGFTVVNLGATRTLNDRAEAYLRVENVFDRDYEVIRGYATPGRSVYVGLRGRF